MNNIATGITADNLHLETGKRYRCANGRWAIICDDYDWRGELRFPAIIEGRATPDWYTSDGLLRGRNVDLTPGAEHPLVLYYYGFRIIGEWAEPVEVWAVVEGVTVIDIFDDKKRASAFASTFSPLYRVVQLVEASS